jgi:hypothetical protein
MLQMILSSALRLQIAKEEIDGEQASLVYSDAQPASLANLPPPRDPQWLPKHLR